MVDESVKTSLPAREESHGGALLQTMVVRRQWRERGAEACEWDRISTDAVSVVFTGRSPGR
jgi:hypothetical protein